MAGRRFVLLEESEHERLCREAREAPADWDEGPLPAFSKPDRRGRLPALEYARVWLARDLIRSRPAVNLSQQQLADLAGLRQEPISRLERGKHTAHPRTVDKIMRAIEAVRRKRRRRGK